MGASGAIDPRGIAGGRPPKTDMQAAMSAILYLLRTGCPWRYLPRDRFPTRSTVYNVVRKFQRDGVWEAIWAELHIALREQMGREASPSVALLDSQSVKSAEEGAAETTRGLRRRQAGEGSKIHTWSTAKGYRCRPSFIPLRSRTATGLVWSSTAYAGASRGSN